MAQPEQVTLEVFRYQPEDAPEPYFQSYEVDYRENWVVLDALNHVKADQDPSLSFRWSCRMGICGSCGMMVNGEAKLTCETFISDYRDGTIRIEPLSHFPVIRDLVINMDDFMEKLPTVSPWLIRQEEKPLEMGEYSQTPGQVAQYKRFSLCINCMLCYSACPVYGLDTTFTGPAALALAERYNLDSRDQGNRERAGVVTAHEGIWECTYVGACTQVCPKDVDPAGAIQMLKLSSALDWARSVVMPRGAAE
ncbi:MAG: succinate dehydrogenase/fumarate reductase iron-sulfur subunit [Actinobacteria bacterium]|nr:succinate dehydrogenase/fumarate reductase iron-sulfur subunit [Actinomycetota bacterium]